MPATLPCPTSRYEHQDPFEKIYQQQDDPWDYYSVAEQAKYAQMSSTAKRLFPAPRRVLDAACSLGYLTAMMADYSPEVFAFDISTLAVQRTRQRCAALKSKTRFKIELGDAIRPHYSPASFDVVFLGDVVRILPSIADQQLAVRNTLELLSDDGILVLTDCMKCTSQKSYISLVESEGGCIQEKIYYNDRYWIKFRSLIKRVGSPEQIQLLLRSTTIHRWLRRLASLRGPAGSKHFGLVVRRATGSDVRNTARHRARCEVA